jgi:hypothetical protein
MAHLLNQPRWYDMDVLDCLGNGWNTRNTRPCEALAFVFCITNLVQKAVAAN